ncbi:MAG: TolC family protein [Coprobacter sp.]|nr:TolC family protein [Coprobacter sp.]
MKQRLTLTLLGVLFFLPGIRAQVSLDECQQLAQENYPLVAKYNLIERSTEYSIKNINRGYLPQLTLSGQASYQSDVASLPDLLNNILAQNGYNPQGLGKDQYKIALDLNQVIWDGGNMRSRKEITRAQSGVMTAQTDVDMYAVRSRVNDLFFGILLIDEKLQLNKDLQALLSDNCRKLEALKTNGIATQSDIDAVKAEYLQTRQDEIKLNTMKSSYTQMLCIFIGKEPAYITRLQKPDDTMPDVANNNRPELALFNSQIKQTDAQKKLLNSMATPRLSLFAQGYYGYPGLNMFDDMFDHDWSLNGIVGVRLTWNISNLYTRRNDKRKLDISRNNIETAREVFLFNNRMKSTQDLSTIEQYRQMLQEDDNIIALRTSVRTAAESKLSHGTIDINALLQEITRESKALIDKSSHEIELLKSIYELKHTINQ